MNVMVQPDIETVFIKMEDDDENFVCNFCSINFLTSCERDQHLETHLIRRNCAGCNKSMILIGNQLYELHLPVDCAKGSPHCKDVTLSKNALNRKRKRRSKEVVHSSEDSFDIEVECIELELEPKIDHHTETPPKPSTSIQLQLVEDDSKLSKSKEQAPVKEKMQTKQYKRHPKTIPCDKCDEMFGVEQSLIVHQRKVHNIVPIHRCDICGLVLKTAVYLKNHLVIHSDTKRFICNYCGKGFHLPYNLREHINQHTGEKPYKCDVCDKRFGRQTLKAAHMRVHTGEKPFKCNYENCDRAYSHLIDLKRHRRTAHGIILKTFECPICSKIFYENKFLTRHLNIHKEKSA